MLDVFLEWDDDAEVRHLELRADASVGRHVIAKRLADDRPFASVRDLHGTNRVSTRRSHNGGGKQLRTVW